MKAVFLIFVLSLFSFKGFSSHIVAGEIFYDCLGGNTYRVTLKLYRDCNSDGADFDPDLPVTVFNGSNVQIDAFSIPFPGSELLVPTFSNPCVTIPPEVCVEEAVYTKVVDLPPSTNGYTLSYQRCCRGPAVTNLDVPEEAGLTLTIEIPPAADAVCNSSPRFNNFPPLLMCVNQELVFDHSATDPDGDIIVYELCTPFDGGTSVAPAPDPASAPPYSEITWAAGATELNPLILGTINLNSNTGLLTATPELEGLFAIGICAKEYRDGVLISVTRRDFQLKVFNCEITMEAIITPQNELSTFETFCDGLSINFENTSYGGTNYLWDFGVDTDVTDVSDDFAPTFTFPAPGSYDVVLVVNPGWTCTDTSVQTFIVNNSIENDFEPPLAQCIIGNSYDFVGLGDYPSVDEGTSFLWEFGDNASQDSSFVESPSGISFDTYGWHDVTYTVFYDVCINSYTDSVFVHAEPTIDFDISDELKCAPYTADFIDLSFATSTIYYSWEFGDGTELSNLQNPSHIYENPGVYDVNLIIRTDEGCIDTLELEKPNFIEVFPSPISDFTVAPDEATVFSPHFYFQDFSQDSQEHYYYFTDGTSSIERNVWHSYVESGYHYPYQVVINEYGCPDTSWQQIYVIPHTTIYIPNAFTPDGGGLNNVWKPVVYDTEQYKLYVYNRWGELMMYSENESASWDGMSPDGTLAPDGVYVYKIWWLDIDTKMPFEKTGHFTLIR